MQKEQGFQEEPADDSELSDTELDEVSGGAHSHSKSKLDETGQQQLKSQMYMDRITKATSTASNAENILSQTSDTITQNLK